MISPGVQRILSTCVASHEALQALLLLHRERERTWHAEEVATALNVQADLARSTLQALVDGQLLLVDTSAAVAAYRYAPGSSVDAAVVDELRQAWLTQPLEIIRVMNTNAIARTRIEAIRAFADAFILRGGRHDD
jgi:hypothetical protein